MRPFFLLFVKDHTAPVTKTKATRALRTHPSKYGFNLYIDLKGGGFLKLLSSTGESFSVLGVFLWYFVVNISTNNLFL